MKSRLVTLLMSLAIVAGAQVNQEELQNQDAGTVEFTNYAGTYARIDTRAEIRNIGYTLGTDARRILAGSGAAQSGAAARYFVILSRSDGPGMNADIFGLGSAVGVDHIRNLRLILQGYLEGAYGYAEADAALLAEYITVYNAVYRGNLAYFGTRYKTAVMGHLTADKAGLSTRYDEWPGRTLMLIPIGRPEAGPLNTIDTTALTSSQVTEQLKQDTTDDAVGIRQDMVDLKERQAEEAAREAETRREEIAAEEERLEEERAEVTVQKTEAQEELARVAEERQEPGANQAALDARERAAEERLEAAEEKEAAIAEREEALEAEKGEVAELEEYAEEKAAEAREDRQEIAGTIQEQIDRDDGTAPETTAAAAPAPAAAAASPVEAAPPVGVVALSIAGSGSPLGRVVKVDPATNQVLKQSPLTNVNTRTLTELNGRIIAVAGEAQGSGAIRLVELSPDTLEMTSQGTDNIAPESLLWVQGANLYAIVSRDGAFYLGRFSAALVLEASSSVPVHPYASVRFEGDYVTTQRADGTAVVLAVKDLTAR